MKRKILIIMHDLAGGGAEKVLLDILKNFNYDKYDVELALIKKSGVYLSEVPAEVNVIKLFNIHEFYIGFGLVKFLNIHFFNKLLTHIRIHKHYDTIISFMEGYPLVVHNYVASQCKCNITWVHIDLYSFHHTKQVFREGSNYEEQCYRKMDKIVFVSKDSAQQFDKLFNVDSSKKNVIYNPIPKDIIIENSKLIDVPKHKFVIGTIGRLSEQKAYDRLIRVAKRFKSQNYDLEFWIVGEGKLRGKLEALQKELQLESYVKLLGFKKNVYPYLAKFDIFLSTSITEGYPLVICEALCLGKAICATKTTGPVELLENNQFGLLTEQDDNSIYQGLKKLIDDTELRTYYQGQAALRSSIFNIEKTIKEIYSIILP